MPAALIQDQSRDGLDSAPVAACSEAEASQTEGAGEKTVKEIKAYVRKSRVRAVVNALQQAGAPGITVVEVHPVGYGYEPNYFEPGFEVDVLSRYKYLTIVKVEVVCSDADTERLIHMICNECHTGERGDGMIFVTDVSGATRIRTGARGEQALRPIKV